MKAGQLFPLADEYKWKTFRTDLRPKDLRVQATGEFRAPRKGEWYISGAIPEGYLSPSKLDYPFHIARLVRVSVRTVETVEEVL